MFTATGSSRTPFGMNYTFGSTIMIAGTWQQDHLGNVRVIVDQSKNVKETNDYYAFGSRWVDASSIVASPANRYRYNGMEEQSWGNLGYYDYNARFYNPAIGRFSSIDPLAEKYYNTNPFVYVANNPLKYIDPTGMSYSEHVEVKLLDNGTYEIVGGIADNDLNIYVVDDKGNRTGEVIGKSLTTHSFMNEENNPILGAIIDPSDNSGVEFLNNEIVEGRPSLTKYMTNATNGGDYDFKALGIENRSTGTRTQYHYRGMPLNDCSSMVGRNGNEVTYGSARDVGNMGAGYVAGRNGLTWQEARAGFDTYQSYKSGKITSEGQPTQLAERRGWENGSAAYWFARTGKSHLLKR